ncbi:Cupredoxin [Cubamyces lactineus]|nr:Cupredoxin [Cubamyces lactineus]
MRFSTVVAALLPVGAALAQQTITVKVGENGTLTYNPNSVTAQNGDTIQFQFLSKNHTVTQSTFAAPCSNITDGNGLVTGVDSGFQFVQPNATQFPVWSITINNASTPLWFYCRQAQHCQSGMVFAVNPTAEKSYDAFKANAAASDAVNGSPQSGSSGASSGTSSGTGASGSNSTGSTGTTGSTTGGSAPAGGNGASPVSTGSTGGTTPTPGATNSNTTNAAGAVQYGAGAMFMTLTGLSLGLLL